MENVRQLMEKEVKYNVHYPILDRLLVSEIFATGHTQITGLPHVREKSGKRCFFQGQGNVREF